MDVCISILNGISSPHAPASHIQVHAHSYEGKFTETEQHLRILDNTLHSSRTLTPLLKLLY